MSALATRRTILGAAGLATIVGATSFVPAPAAAVPASSLADRIARYKAARGEREAYSRDVLAPLTDRLRAATEAYPKAHVPYSDEDGGPSYLETGEPHSMWLLNLHRIKQGHMERQPAWRRDAVAAFDRAEREREAGLADLVERSGLDAANERYEALADIALDAMVDVQAYPVTTAADLAAKVAFIDEMDWWDDPDTHTGILSDVRRLAGVA